MDRSCGGCSVCCEVAAVPDLGKEAHASCPLLRVSESGCCSVVNVPSKRPRLCSDFSCSWLVGVGSKGDRPDKIGVMFSVNNVGQGVVGFAVESEPGAVTTTGRDMAVQFARTHPMPLIVSEYMKETAGEWVIIHDDLSSRAEPILGNIVEHLSDDVTMYERRVPSG